MLTTLQAVYFLFKCKIPAHRRAYKKTQLLLLGTNFKRIYKKIKFNSICKNHIIHNLCYFNSFMWFRDIDSILLQLRFHNSNHLKLFLKCSSLQNASNDIQVLCKHDLRFLLLR